MYTNTQLQKTDLKRRCYARPPAHPLNIQT